MVTLSREDERVLSDEQLADGGLKKTVAWVRDEKFSKTKRNAAQRQKESRDKKKREKNEKQVNLYTIDDETAVATLRAVAEAIKDPSSLAVIGAVVGNDVWLRWLIKAVSIERFRAIEGSSPEDAARLWRGVRTAIEIAINNDCVTDLIHDAAASIDRIDQAPHYFESGSWALRCDNCGRSEQLLVGRTDG